MHIHLYVMIHLWINHASNTYMTFINMQIKDMSLTVTWIPSGLIFHAQKSLTFDQWNQQCYKSQWFSNISQELIPFAKWKSIKYLMLQSKQKQTCSTEGGVLRARHVHFLFILFFGSFWNKFPKTECKKCPEIHLAHQG